jgi:hypothetical protein
MREAIFHPLSTLRAQTVARIWFSLRAVRLGGKSDLPSKMNCLEDGKDATYDHAAW